MGKLEFFQKGYSFMISHLDTCYVLVVVQFCQSFISIVYSFFLMLIIFEIGL